MPVLRFKLSRLLQALNHSVALSELLETLRKIKGEPSIVEDGEVLEIEIDRDRPDMFSLHGLAEAIRLYLGLSKPRRYGLKNIEVEVHVDPPRKRPYIAVGVVKNVRIDEEMLEELIQLQEKLHLSYGRRKRVAIGLHDYDKLPSKRVEYRYVPLTSCFKPLHLGKPMSIAEVIEATEQGREYGWISLDGDLHPALISGDEIIAIPPVLNSDVTRVEPGTRNLFIDVTGTDPRIVNEILNVIVYSLWLAGGEIHGAKVIRPEGVVLTPCLEWRKLEVSRRFVAEWLGLNNLSCAELNELLNKMGLHLAECGDSSFTVEVPPHRIDVLHPVDVLEDLAIAIGYDELEPINVPSYVVSKPSALTSLARVLRDLAVGLGYVEMNSLTLTSSELLSRIGLESFARISNPIQKELDALKPSPLPSILQTLVESQHRRHPVKVFEVCECVVPSSGGWRNRLLMGMAVLSSVVKFEDVHADAFALLRCLGIEPRTRRCSQTPPYAIEGRCAEIVVNNVVLGLVCELSPRVLEDVGIEYPVGYIEIDVEKLLEVGIGGSRGEA